MSGAVGEVSRIEELPSGQRRQRRTDLAIGIVLGVILGIAVIWAFVFWGSEGSVDAPRLEGVSTGKLAPPAAAGRHPSTSPVGERRGVSP